LPLREGNEFFVELQNTEFRDATSKQYETGAREAYLSMTSFLPARSEMRYGLIPDFWVELEREQWGYDFWGVNSYMPLIKYKYSSWSDLGLMYQGELPDDWGQWSLSITNGEGLQSEETGPRKQVQLILAMTKTAPFYAMVSYVQGSYDNYDDSFNKKQRILLHMSYEFQKGLLALEAYDTKDPADAIQTEGMGGGVDVTDLHATNVEGQGATLYGIVKLNEKSDLFLRADWLNPVKTNAQKFLQDITAGVSYDMTDDIRWALAYEYTHYSDEFSDSARDQSLLTLATRVYF